MRRFTPYSLPLTSFSPANTQVFIYDAATAFLATAILSNLTVFKRTPGNLPRVEVNTGESLMVFGRRAFTPLFTHRRAAGIGYDVV